MRYSRTTSFCLATLCMVLLAVFFTPDASAQQQVCPEGNGRAIQMMVGIPGLPPDGCARTLPEYINEFYLFLITVGAIVGVIKIGLAGFKYATSDIVSSKSEAKKDIQGVFLGLIILLLPFLVLNTLSPNAANLDVLDLEPIGEGGGSFNAAAQNQPPAGPGPNVCFVIDSHAISDYDQVGPFYASCDAAGGTVQMAPVQSGQNLLNCVACGT